jgi:1-acyl-sn-glycerol-3-phosphate acyltransferase
MVSTLILLLILLFFSALRINFKEDISSFLPKNQQDTDRVNYVYQNIGSANNLLLFVNMADTTVDTDKELIMEAMEYFVEQLQQADSNQKYLENINYKTDPQQIRELSQFLTKNMPYFLTESDYIRMDSLLTEENVKAQMEQNKRMLMSPISTVIKQNIIVDPLHWSVPILSGLRDFQVSDHFQLYNDFIFSKDQKEGIITIESKYPMSETGENTKLLKLIDHAIANTKQHADQKVDLHYFGAVDISVTNANRIRQDTMLSIIISVILILSILIFVFRSVKKLMLMLLSLLFGWLFALGLLSILKPEVSLIAIGISSIMLGIAMNYPLHFMLHQKHEPRIRNVIKDIVTPLTIGNISTVGAFLSLLFIGSGAMHDLGLFASLLLIGTIIFVLVFLPHLLKNKDNKMEHETVFEKSNASKPKRNKWFTWVFVVLSIVFCIFSFNTGFETDMQKINYMTKTQKEDFAKVVSTIEQGQQTVYYVSEGKTMEDALIAYEDSKTKLDSMQTDGTLSKVSGLGIYLPSKKMQKQRLEQWKTFCKSKQDILNQIDKIGVECGFKSNAFSLFDTIINANYEVREIDYFEPVISSLAHNYIIDKDKECMIVTVLHTPDKELDAIEADLNSINDNSFSFDAGATVRTMVGVLSADFNMVIFICGFIVFIFLVFSLGRIELSLLAFFPLTLGWFWILGIMNIFDIRFNIVNIILATFIFGQGDDYTIFMTEGLMYEYTYRRKMLTSYKKSILLSAIIMFIGIGALIFAKHPAMKSLAEVTIIGMGSVILMTFLLPPIVFRWLTQHKGKPRLIPLTLVNFVSSVLAFSAFLVGSFILNATGFFLFTFGKTTDKKKLKYHILLYKVAKFVMMHFPQVKTTYNSYDKTIFDKPSIIICNHQSHIDLMCIMSLSPKLVILTNDWVWNSLFYGRLIKYADYYPVSKGIDNVMEKLQTNVEKGYSVVIFPEGTRSEDCSILRFHRGAFYLAEQLKLDILPIIIHGVGHLLPKKELMLRKGEIHIHVMQRMNYNALGNNYIENSKNMRKFYKEEYAKLSAQIETPDYYSDLVIHNYIYKGPAVERTVRKNLRRHNNYKEVIEQLFNCKRVLIRNCGLGELPLLLSLVHKNIEVVATDKEQDNLDLASNCNSIPSNLKYLPFDDCGEIDSFDSIVYIEPKDDLVQITKS